jgi:hypothetical protein
LMMYLQPLGCKEVNCVIVDVDDAICKSVKRGKGPW